MVVLTQITLERQTEESLNRFEAAVRRCPEVRDCYLMTGLSDYLMRIEVLDAGDYERLHKEVLSRLPGWRGSSRASRSGRWWGGGDDNR